MYYMEIFNCYTLLETKMMDRIMKDYWGSNIDTSGDFMSNSTCYQILTVSNIGHIEDFETVNRFYSERHYKKIRPHGFMYKVYIQSMQQRYFIEVLVFLTLAVVFQIYIDKFNTSEQLLVVKLA